MIRDYSDYAPTLKSHGEWLQAVGSLIITYNGAEAELRRLAGRLSTWVWQGDRPQLIADIVTLELGNQSLDLMLRTLANETLTSEEARNVIHATDYVSRLREYRNFFIHGLNGDLYFGSEGPGGLITVRSAKGSIKLHPKIVLTSEMQDVARHCWAARVYISDLNSYFEEQATTNQVRSAALPQRPAMINRMEKPSYRLR